MLALALVILTVGYALYPLVHEAWQGFAVAIVSGIGVGGSGRRSRRSSPA